jgi:hypothetical protein
LLSIFNSQGSGIPLIFNAEEIVCLAGEGLFYITGLLFLLGLLDFFGLFTGDFFGEDFCLSGLPFFLNR